MRLIAQVVGLAILASLGGCRAGDVVADLDAAVRGGGERRLSSQSAVPLSNIPGLALGSTDPGNDSIVPMPVGHCWSDDRIMVLDRGAQHVGVFSKDGEFLTTIGEGGEGPGEFARPGAIACSHDGSRILVADAGNNRVSFFSGTGELVGEAATPAVPQGIPYVGEFAVGTEGIWYDSWLGARVGPYLTEPEWRGQSLFRAWNADGSPKGGFGRIRAYSDVVARRVFNRTDLDLVRDTLWVLTEADARLRAFSGGQVVNELWLPVYHRGSDPLRIVDGGDGPGYRRNRIIYEPNVADFAWLNGRSALAILRYRNWMSFERGDGPEAYTQFWPESSVEVRDPQGGLLFAWSVPGFAKQISTNGSDRVSVLSEDRDSAAEEIWVFELPDTIIQPQLLQGLHSLERGWHAGSGRRR